MHKSENRETGTNQFGSLGCNVPPSGWRVLLATLATALITVAAVAQVPTGAIVGTVKDAQGLPIADAAVTVTNQGTGAKFITRTSQLGAFQVVSIEAALYTVQVEKQSFRTSVVTNIKLDTGTQFSVPPIVLELGSLAETVTVESGGVQVNTINAEITGTVEKKQIDALPLLNRSPLNLIGLQAGVNRDGKTNTVINGQRSMFTNLALDGINIQDNFIRTNDLDFSPNLVLASQAQEFTFTTSNAGVSAGLGSSQVGFVTPSGGNQWHGEGFWYYRSGKWSANNWFNNATGVAKPSLLQNQGGGNAGGPIIKKKLFVYGYYELFRRRQQTAKTATVLTASARQGLFSYVPTNGTTPVTVNLLTLKTPFTIDPVIGSQLLARVPTTINSSGVGDGRNTGGFRFNQRNNRTRDNYGFKADYDLNLHHHFVGTWSWNRDALDRPDIDNSYNIVPVVSNSESVKFVSAAWRWSPKSSFTNEVRFGFNLAPAIFNTTQDFSRGFVFSGLAFTDPNTTFQFQGRNTNTWGYQDNANWTKGNHSFSFGAQLQRVTVNAFNRAFVTPTYFIGFSAANASALAASDFRDPIADPDRATANSLLATLAGVLSSETQRFNVTSQTSGFVPGAINDRNFRQNHWAVYGSDSWRLRKNLTFNYGVRWEYLSPFNERDGLLLQPVIASGQTVRQALLNRNTQLNFVGGSGRLPYDRQFNAFAPNISAAWDPWGDGKTSFRAGYSINYVNDEFITAVNASSTTNTGLVLTSGPANLAGPTVSNPAPIPTPAFTVPVTFSQNLSVLGGVATGQVANNSGYAVDPNLRTPFVQQWNIGVERNIGWQTTVSVSYVGNHAQRLLRGIDLNQVIIQENGFLGDYLRARANGFLALGTPSNAPGCGSGDRQCGVFNPLFNPGLNGSQPLTVLPQVSRDSLAASAQRTGGLRSTGVVNLIRNGQVGQLVDLFHTAGADLQPNAIPLVANPALRGAGLLENYSHSTWNAGIVEIRRRFRSGVYFQANYTFSKALTDNTGIDQSHDAPFLDNARPQLDKGRAAFDVTHAFKGNFVYDLPIGRGHKLAPSNGILSQVVSGWQVSSIFSWQSGPPFSITTGGVGSFIRAGNSGNNSAVAALPPQALSSLVHTTVGTRNGKPLVLGLDPSVILPNGTGAPSPSAGLTCTPIVSNGFCNPGPGMIGNLQKFAFDGPAFFNWDFSASKSFHITESKKLEYRAEFFNFTNHPVFDTPNGNINSTTFGQITSTLSTARIVQMALRLTF